MNIVSILNGLPSLILPMGLFLILLLLNHFEEHILYGPWEDEE